MNNFICVAKNVRYLLLFLLFLSCSSGGSNNGSTPNTGGTVTKTYGLRVTKRVIEDFTGTSKSKHFDIFSADENTIIQRIERNIQSKLQSIVGPKILLDQPVNGNTLKILMSR